MSVRLTAALVLVACAAAPATAAAAPAVRQMVVFRSGKAESSRVSTASVGVRVGRKRCAVPSRTPLAALVRSRPGRLRLRDYGSCSRRARDAGGLFVTGIGPDRNRGQSGWVYKVGRKAASAGAADPSGPFGRGRLRSGQRILWFYCRVATNCQRTLQLRARAGSGGAVTVSVRGYDDVGRGVAVAGATVRLGSRTATTDAAGAARFQLAPGRYRASAAKRGLVRSFTERVVVP